LSNISERGFLYSESFAAGPTYTGTGAQALYAQIISAASHLGALLDLFRDPSLASFVVAADDQLCGVGTGTSVTLTSRYSMAVSFPARALLFLNKLKDMKPSSAAGQLQSRNMESTQSIASAITVLVDVVRQVDQ
jgi:hypothetical protein